MLSHIAREEGGQESWANGVGRTQETHLGPQVNHEPMEQTDSDRGERSPVHRAGPTYIINFYICLGVYICLHRNVFPH